MKKIIIILFMVTILILPSQKEVSAVEVIGTNPNIKTISAEFKDRFAFGQYSSLPGYSTVQDYYYFLSKNLKSYKPASHFMATYCSEVVTFEAGGYIGGGTGDPIDIQQFNNTETNTGYRVDNNCFSEKLGIYSGFVDVYYKKLDMGSYYAHTYYLVVYTDYIKYYTGEYPSYYRVDTEVTAVEMKHSPNPSAGGDPMKVN